MRQARLCGAASPTSFDTSLCAFFCAPWVEMNRRSCDCGDHFFSFRWGIPATEPPRKAFSALCAMLLHAECGVFPGTIWQLLHHIPCSVAQMLLGATAFNT